MKPDLTSSQPVCSHCGAEVYSAPVVQNAAVFCCDGCKTVYEILQQHNLCEYYQISDNRERNLNNKPYQTTVYDVLKSNEVAAEFIDYTNEKLSIVGFVLPTMHCASCVWLLERLNTLHSGVKGATVDISRKHISVTIDATSCTVYDVAVLLNSVGYPPQLVRQPNSTSTTLERTRLYQRMAVAGIATGNVMMLSISQYLARPAGLPPTLEMLFQVLSIVLAIPVLVFSASPWLTSAWKSIQQKRINLDVPVAIGLLTVVVRSIVEIANKQSEGYLDSFVMLVFFLLVGKLFQQRAFDTIEFERTLASFLPLAVRIQKNGTEIIEPIKNIRIGDICILRNEEIIPCDCVIVEHSCVADYSFVTGEATLHECLPGSTVYAGGKVKGAFAKMYALKTVDESSLAGMWEKSKKHKSYTLYDTLNAAFGKYFSLTVLAVAIAVFLYWLPNVSTAVTAFTSVVIIACPCAFTLAAPIAYGAAMSTLSRKGIYVQNVGVFPELEKISKIFFDKTGTLTTTENVRYEGRELSPEEIQLVAITAMSSTHPMSAEVFRWCTTKWPQSINAERVQEYSEQIGIGGRAIIANTEIVLGKTLEINGEYCGRFIYQGTLRKGIEKMLVRLRKHAMVGVISGDSEQGAEALRHVFSTNELQMSSSPTDKVYTIAKAQKSERVMMVGDGLNDAQSLAVANLGVAVCNSALLVFPAADIVLSGEQVQYTDTLLRVAKELRLLINITLIITILYNAFAFWLAATGKLSPVIVAIMMPVNSLVIVLGSLLGSRWLCRRHQWE